MRTILGVCLIAAALPSYSQQPQKPDSDPMALSKQALESAAIQAKAMQQGGNRSSQNQQGDPLARTQQAMQKALSQMSTQQVGEARNGTKNGLSPEELRRFKGADPAEIASRYQQTGPGVMPYAPEFKIFISTSMPREALEMIGQQAKLTGAVLVLRGMKGRLGTKNLMEITTEALAPVAKTGASMMIDPEAFQRYGVTAVPTFVMATKEADESCAADQCDSQSYTLAGDVTVQYALEHWSKQGGAVGKQADVFLKRLEQARK